MTTSLFDRVSGLVAEIGAEKQAAAREKSAETGIPDPGGAEGGTSHPSKKTDDDLQPETQGFQSADNERIVKDQIPDAVDTKPDATEGNAPKATDVQQGQGVDQAKPTGTDSATEEDYKGKLEGDKREGDQGGTSHPAKGDYGEKYSSDAITGMTDNDLLKNAADLGNELTADIANGHFTPKSASPNTAAAAGQQTAKQAGDVGERLEDIASGVVQEIVKSAYHQADLVVDHLSKEMKILKKAEGEAEDPTSGAGEGEDHGTEEEGSDPNEEPSGEYEEGMGGGEEAPPEGAEELLAAMGGGGEMGGAPEMGGGMGGPEMGGELGGGMPGGEMGGGMPGAEMGGTPPEMGGMGGPEMGGGMPGPEMGGMGGPEMGGGMGGPEMGGAPAEMGGMGNEQALQQLAMALMEAGIDPAQLAALAGGGAGGGMGGPAEKIASAVHGHRRSGKFRFTEAKEGSADRKVRDYMKGFVLELYNRSRK